MGRHGLDERNEAGEELLQISAMNQWIVINKKKVYGMGLEPILLLGCPI